MKKSGTVDLSARLSREREHGHVILEGNESNWGWKTPAGIIRKKRRADFLTAVKNDFSENIKVLEVGCGTGTFTSELSKRFSNLTAIDISDPLLELAKSKFPGVQFVRGDIHKTSFEDQSFDLILGCSVLHHLEWELALTEMKRILKPGGQIRFSEPNLLNPQIFIQKNWPWLKKRVGDSPDEYAFTPSQIHNTLSKIGYKNILVKPYEFLHPSTPKNLIEAVSKFENLLEKTPLKSFGGSIQISAQA